MTSMTSIYKLNAVKLHPKEIIGNKKLELLEFLLRIAEAYSEPSRMSTTKFFLQTLFRKMLHGRYSAWL